MAYPKCQADIDVEEELLYQLAGRFEITNPGLTTSQKCLYGGLSYQCKKRMLAGSGIKKICHSASAVLKTEKASLIVSGSLGPRVGCKIRGT